MSDFDLAIAVHALAYGLILVSADRARERLRLTRESWLGWCWQGPHRGRWPEELGEVGEA
jgi:hypothetical protein